MEGQQKKNGDPPAVPPGWNDPPMLKYTPQNPPPKSRITNKRVAFPVGPPSSTEELPKPSVHSPLKTSLPPLALPLIPLGQPCNTSLFAKASTNFNNLIDKIEDHDIKDRVNQMLNDWQTGKFTNEVQNTLTDFSTCIVDNNLTGAKELFSRLNVPNDGNIMVKPYLSSLKYLFM
ncbi:unnamed protein product [Ceutorhynchus assimilis]|uniref:Uncharacterized protein n=1 Tax=Ceutorhynchus assimilis TaxID=467358 RepID=A0A9N9QJ10_9CUCU|nr:unnamed protein product [Ceutorhynchus assimilis]